MIMRVPQRNENNYTILDCRTLPAGEFWIKWEDPDGALQTVTPAVALLQLKDNLDGSLDWVVAEFDDGVLVSPVFMEGFAGVAHRSTIHPDNLS